MKSQQSMRTIRINLNTSIEIKISQQKLIKEIHISHKKFKSDKEISDRKFSTCSTGKS